MSRRPVPPARGQAALHLLARVDLTTPLLVGWALSTAAGLVWSRFLAGLPDPRDLPEDDAAATTDAPTAGSRPPPGG